MDFPGPTAAPPNRNSKTHECPEHQTNRDEPLPQSRFRRLSRDAAEIVPTEVEQQIAEIWKTQLKMKQVGIHDNFFDLGGYSLLMVQIHKQLQTHFGQTISIVELFRQPTIHLLANYLTDKVR